MSKKCGKAAAAPLFPGEPDELHNHLRKRHGQNVRMNINHLGEALLGEEEALHRLRTYIDDMKDPDIEYISVKISTIYSQISSLAFDHTVRCADGSAFPIVSRRPSDHRFTSGTTGLRFPSSSTWIWRNTGIWRSHTRLFVKHAWRGTSSGIIPPESCFRRMFRMRMTIQKELTRMGSKTRGTGGAAHRSCFGSSKAPIWKWKWLESSLFNWPLAPYDNKLDVDANYKRMVLFGMQPDNIRVVNLGIASHNLFELAFAYELAKTWHVTPYFYFEMLEGMADHVRRALCETSDDVLLYAPVASRDEFINAIAYLIRRLDENTSPENFLRYAPHLKVGSDEWQYLSDQFVESCRHIDQTPGKPHRTQDRNTEVFPEQMGTFYTHAFTNEPDTDWALAANRKWAEGHTG
jgi:RHH-type proline utilization regulon transcriptional repressor/proline dehydrogenase/delta 1-pyrroline-5-carboxylate dehydrogenase